MRNKKIFSFDETKDANEIITNGFPDNTIDYSKMYLIAKYFRQTYKYGEIRLERELIKFCKEHDQEFNPVIEAESIKKWVKSAMNYNLRKIESVTISAKEVGFLKSIEKEKDRKILFVTLILSKALKKRSTKENKTELKTSSKYYIRYSNLMDIIRLSKLTNFSELDLADLFHKYTECFTFYSAEQELIRLDYVDINPKTEIIIGNLECILDYYDLLFGKRKLKGVCQNCGREFIKKAGNQKVCENCILDVKKEQTRKRQIKWRKNHESMRNI